MKLTVDSRIVPPDLLFALVALGHLIDFEALDQVASTLGADLQHATTVSRGRG
jgi:hypothetical protein